MAISEMQTEDIGSLSLVGIISLIRVDHDVVGSVIGRIKLIRLIRIGNRLIIIGNRLIAVSGSNQHSLIVSLINSGSVIFEFNKDEYGHNEGDAVERPSHNEKGITSTVCSWFGIAVVVSTCFIGIGAAVVTMIPAFVDIIRIPPTAGTIGCAIDTGPDDCEGGGCDDESDGSPE